jgi:hypothetical protein
VTTANWVFDRAIHLMDEQNETNGKTRTQDTKEYEYRTLSILNVLRNELYPYSDTYEVRTDGRRPVCVELTSMEQPIDLDDALCQSVLPYGLAAHLLLGENDTMASFFNQRYAEMQNELRSRSTAEWEDIPFSFTF